MPRHGVPTTSSLAAVCVCMLALCLDVVDEDLYLFQGVADDLILDILPVVAQCYFSLHVLQNSNGS